MTTMVTEVYDALLSAGADDAKARRAAEVLTDFENGFDRVGRRIDEVEVKLERRIAQVEVKLEGRIGEVEVKLERRIGEVEVKLERRIDGVEAKLELYKAELGGKIVLLQWQLGILIAGVTAIILKLFV